MLSLFHWKFCSVSLLSKSDPILLSIKFVHNVLFFHLYQGCIFFCLNILVYPLDFLFLFVYSVCIMNKSFNTFPSILSTSSFTKINALYVV